MIDIDIPQFKKGVFDICKLFKTMFQNDRNIIISKNDINYINNLDQLFSLKTSNNTSYNFAINYTLTQIQNFRENICINPILYITAFEQLISGITSFRDLEKYDFKKVVDFLKWYYENSNLSKAKINKLDIQRLFYKERQDKFLSKIIDLVCNRCNVEIVESKVNNLIKHKYYKLRANYVCGQLYGSDYRIFITDTITKDLFIKLVNVKLPILVLCNNIDFEITNSYRLSIFKVTPTEILKNYDCICLLTGFGRGYQNLEVEELNSYSFGAVREFKFIEGTLQFSGTVQYEAKQVEQFNKKETLDKYYALQGRNLLIECTEEYLEKVKSIVSTIKALQNDGIFYTETKALKVIMKSFDNDSKLKCFIYDLVKNYLSLFHFDYNKIQQVIDNGNLSASFNVNTGSYDDGIFTSLDYYLNIFSLLDSNVKTLGKLGIR